MWSALGWILCSWLLWATPGFAGDAQSLPVLETLNSPRFDAAKSLDAHTTLHVFLQVHATATLDGAVVTPVSARCQEQIERSILALHKEGRFRAVVGEGLVARGLAHAPSSLRSWDGPTHSAVTRLIGVQGLDVYGMERSGVQSWGMAQLETMAQTAAALETLAAADKSDAEKHAALPPLERSLFLSTTAFAAGNIPVRSFQAIQTALAISVAYGQREVAVVIGLQHWPDFVHAVRSAGRLGTGRYGALQVHQYACENGAP